MDRLQAARQHVGPAIIAIHGRGGAVGDRIAEGHDGEGICGCGHLNRIEEEPGCRGVEECRLVLQRPLGAGAGCGDVGGGERLGVPGHRAAVAGDMEADREPAAGEFVRLFCEWQRDRVTPCRTSGWDGDGRLSAERHRTVGPAQQRSTARLQADIHAVERHWFLAERIAEPDARLAAPQIGPHHQAKGLVPRAGRRVREGEFLIGLGRRVADGIGALGRAGPRHHPALAIPGGCGLRQRGEQRRDHEVDQRAHGVSPPILSLLASS